MNDFNATPIDRDSLEIKWYPIKDVPPETWEKMDLWHKEGYRIAEVTWTPGWILGVLGYHSSDFTHWSPILAPPGGVINVTRVGCFLVESAKNAGRNLSNARLKKKLMQRNGNNHP